ncbi:c-type cytochrome [Massilia terrae]|uniref:C-type cytochrome n=1 Tax=Massilia terrae TaxID=1811224 RepID=A0ABT2D1Q8_9BURK|nr:c-type cytochrome [Massilia terrae]MCS0660176.1 c-type cytochrome [Massilia terrae]
MRLFAHTAVAVSLSLSATAQAASDAVPDTLAQRLTACTSCHARKDPQGVPGTDRYFPRIAGKPAGYLYNQLINFREGRRQYPLMTYMVDHLPDAYLHDIADYFSNEHLPYPPPAASDAAPAVLERGRQLATKGDATLKVPACMACHGERLTGVAPAIPGLAGLPRDYINAQFGAWRNKTRKAQAPDCMAAIAARLSLADVAAVSSWLAAQPVPPDASPATSIARPLPLACGSMPEAAR